MTSRPVKGRMPATLSLSGCFSSTKSISPVWRKVFSARSPCFNLASQFSSKNQASHSKLSLSGSEHDRWLTLAPGNTSKKLPHLSAQIGRIDMRLSRYFTRVGPTGLSLSGRSTMNLFLSSLACHSPTTVCCSRFLRQHVGTQRGRFSKRSVTSCCKKK